MFRPTFLYIKQHTVTGKMYFGKTIKDPEKYLGSGIYWKNHIHKYGKQYVVNLWYCLFLEQNECVLFANEFSRHNKIVESDLWANQIDENGLDGGGIPSTETRKKMSLAKIGKKPGNYGRIVPNDKIHKWSAEEKVRRTINHPTRKSITTPYGTFLSCNEFINQVNIAGNKSIYNIVNNPNKILSKHNYLKSGLFKEDDIDKTYKEIGWYYSLKGVV